MNKSILVYKFLDAHFAIKSLYEKRLKISRMEDLNDPFEGRALASDNPTVTSHVESVRSHWGYGLLCFSSSWSSPLMWAHYADKHRGICLAFEILDTADRILYESDRGLLPLDATKMETREAVIGYDLRKFKEWSYEEEVRLKKRLTGEGLCFEDFGADLRLTTVILGLNCSVPLNEVMRAIGDPSIKIIKAALSHTEYKIIESDLPPA